MKADHRHELKTNELADWLAHFPQWAQENQTTLIGAGVVLVLAIAVYFLQFYRKDVVQVRQHDQLTNLVTQIPIQERNIAQAASQGTDQSVQLLPVAQDLQSFASSTGNDRMAALALIKQAEALRAELHYRVTDPSADDVAKQIAQAQSSYQKALERAASIPTLAATAEFGLGLCEEELGHFDKAKEIYRAVAENPDYEGTTAQAVATYRLKSVDDYQGEVVFKPAPAPTSATASTPTIQIGPDAVNNPISIEATNDIDLEPLASEANNVGEPNTAAGGAGTMETTDANEPASN